MKNLVLIATISFLFNACRKDDSIQPQENILYETNFSENDGHWWTGNINNISCSIENGYYVYKNTKTDGLNFVTIDPIFTGITGTTAIETSIKISSAGSDLGAGGLIWNRNYQQNSDFEFTINGTGKFRISGYPDGSFTAYKDWTIHSAVRINSFNILRIELRSDKLHFFINGTEVYSMNPVNNNSLDRCGFAAGYSTLLQADYFKAFELK